jgi:autotransporter-associated beta strand protein
MSGTFILTGNSTYSGVTDVLAGELVLDGNLQSLVTDNGGVVSGWFFRDPRLTAASMPVVPKDTRARGLAKDSSNPSHHIRLYGLRQSADHHPPQRAGERR